MKSFFHCLMVTLSVLTWTFTPLAEAARQKKTETDRINAYFKSTGLSNKNTTYGEYWRKNRTNYPKNLRPFFDAWMAQHRLETVPDLQVSRYKDNRGKEQYRVVLSQKGQTLTFSYSDNPKKALTVNGVVFTAKEAVDFKLVLKRLLQKDPSARKSLQAVIKKPNRSLLSKNIILTGKEFRALTAPQKAEYLYRARKTIIAAQKVYSAFYGAQALNDLQHKFQNRSFVFNWLMGFTNAQAEEISDLAEPSEREPASLPAGSILPPEEVSRPAAVGPPVQLVPTRPRVPSAEPSSVNPSSSSRAVASRSAAASSSRGSRSGLTGKPCIVAGYLSIYGENQSCGGNTAGQVDLQNKMSSYGVTCSGGGVACNPLVYGFKGDGAYCVNRSQIKYATRECNRMSPLNISGSQEDLQADKKRIIESFMKKMHPDKKVDLQFNAEGKISDEQYKEIEQYLSELNNYINTAVAECDQAPLGPPQASSSIQSKRPDQISACTEIRTRAFSLQTFAANPAGGTANPPTANNCEDQQSGTVPSENQPTACVPPVGVQCPTNSSTSSSSGDTTNTSGAVAPPCVVQVGEVPTVPGDEQSIVDAVTEPGVIDRDKGVAAADTSSWLSRNWWLLPVGVGLGLGILCFVQATGGTNGGYCADNDNKGGTPAYVPPAVDPDPVTPDDDDDDGGDDVTPPPPAPPTEPNGTENGPSQEGFREKGRRSIR